MPGQSGPGNNGNEGVLHIPQSPSITGTLPSDCLVSYQDTHWEGAYPSVEVQSVYSTAQADWAIISWIGWTRFQFSIILKGELFTSDL